MIEFRDNKYASKLSKDTIVKFEEENGIKFPDSYIDILLNHHGSRIEPSGFNVYWNDEKEEYSVDELLEMSRDEDAFGDIPDYMEILHLDNGLSKKIIPFGADAGGNLMCFDYRESDFVPKIVFWKHDEDRGLDSVSDSFDQFLDKLY